MQKLDVGETQMSAYARKLPLVTVRFQYKADIRVDCSERLLSSYSVEKLDNLRTYNFSQESFISEMLSIYHVQANQGIYIDISRLPGAPSSLM